MTTDDFYEPDESVAVQQLRRLLEPADDDLARLRASFDLSAAEQGLIDVAFRTVDSPVGALLLAATGAGLVRVAFEVQDFDRTLQELADRVSPRVLEAPARLDPVVRQLDEYFEGRRHTFDLELDHTLSHGFRLQVQRHLPDIPYGRTESYREVADAVGSPRAVRAVGSACATNPLPVVVPCHRVLRSDGSLGGYAGGLAAKTALLTLEGVAA